jgi:hypothetical protein
MAKTILLATPLSTATSSAIAASLHQAASALSGTLNERVDIVGPSFGSSTPTAHAIREQIAGIDMLVADVSGSNANVMLEIGFAQALGKPLLLLARDSADIPFNLRDHPFLLYELSGYSFLVPRIADALNSAFVVPETGSKRRGPSPKKVFISYSHADSAYLQRILVHLRPLERAGLIDPWSDTRLHAGDRWREEIRAGLEKAGAAILLISADFLASEFIATDELPPLLHAAEERGTRIIPIILKPSGFVRDHSLSMFQALNDPATPVIGMVEADREALYAKLADVLAQDIHVADDEAT